MHALLAEIDCSVQDVGKTTLQEYCSTAIATGMMRPIVGLLSGENGGWTSVSSENRTPTDFFG
jgi:hypothetical protein